MITPPPSLMSIIKFVCKKNLLRLTTFSSWVLTEQSGLFYRWKWKHLRKRGGKYFECFVTQIRLTTLQSSKIDGIYDQFCNYLCLSTLPRFEQE